MPKPDEHCGYTPTNCPYGDACADCGEVERIWRKVRADDYLEPLAGMIRRGEIEPPDEFVIEDA